MSSNAILPLVLFMVLLLAVALCGLAGSGHFPREHRSPDLTSGAGPFILFGSLALSVLCLAAGLWLARRAIPWYANVIGGGAVLLAAPLLLRLLSDHFVNGRGALIAFSGASLLTVLLLRALAP
jgi:hypothetical protein